MPTLHKTRLDILLTERGLAESRTQAQRLVMAGQVRVDGQVAAKPSEKVLENAAISVDHGPRFVSRGGEKLEGALQAFGLQQLDGMICADLGASTGGFTDCMLQHGAARVYAVDVGYGILHWKLRNDPRVVVMERVNARYVSGFPEPVQFVTIDASFISLKILLPVVKTWWLQSQGQVVALIKPQFEAGREEVARGDGVVRDAAVHRSVLEQVLAFTTQEGFGVRGLVRSSLLGPKGNTEFLVWLEYPARQAADVNALIEQAVQSPLPDGEGRRALE
ncbi:hemolysin TlyA family protein [Longilinea arvoryzae]|uniref:Hemolysin TlyA family protein n=1 Tax=Longilinea arvoryzae TaxID=360412 RepID=A0A0S7BL50_9CHLR|nr:TlyA family RNA methyltransferase [Longilinea arvoryzae]GAP14410.1 hemolysin TlyA family protein [Longilinea arvoryzae]